MTNWSPTLPQSSSGSLHPPWCTRAAALHYTDFTVCTKPPYDVQSLFRRNGRGCIQRPNKATRTMRALHATVYTDLKGKAANSEASEPIRQKQQDPFRSERATELAGGDSAKVHIDPHTLLLHQQVASAFLGLLTEACKLLK